MTHFGHLVPPQSMSVSSSFRMPSVHDDAEMRNIIQCQHSQQHLPTQMPIEQSLLRQSLFTEHCLVSAHAGHDLPPQSTSVSKAFVKPSKHVGASKEDIQKKHICIMILHEVTRTHVDRCYSYTTHSDNHG